MQVYTKKNIIDPRYYMHYHFYNIMQVWIERYKRYVYCWKDRRQDSLKFACRYLDGDSNFKIEAI